MSIYSWCYSRWKEFHAVFLYYSTELLILYARSSNLWTVAIQECIIPGNDFSQSQAKLLLVVFQEFATLSWFQTKSQTVRFLSWKSESKNKSFCQRGFNRFLAHSLQIPAKTYLLKERRLPSAGNWCVRVFTREWSFSSREIFVFKNTFFSSEMINM